MSNDDIVHLEVDGVPVEGRKGQMLIEVTDAVDRYVPRFCYHHKLSVAANCRMCLVEVERAPKPLPACATPIGEGMKVWTRSPRAIAAQRATMEFLLINHPLDCPICDQGGECELQDLAMGFGNDISRYTEAKRVVDDEDLGPLISTDMTRCIHCTRCVRFGQEVAGVPVLGTMGRGEDMLISTYVEKTIDHELSGNIIDLCPVGALNSKPYRYRARSWEMLAHPLVSPHDCVGSNMWGHVHRGKLMRVVPRENEAINETWLSDRDRFSYEAVYSPDRLTAPLIRRDGQWQEADWTTALDFAATRLAALVADGSEALGVLASPSSTVEEFFLLQQLARGIGCHNLDHRLRTGDFRDQEQDTAAPSLGLAVEALENRDAVLVIGSNLRREAPILAHRVRKAALAGARIDFVNPVRFDYHFPVAGYIESGADLVGGLGRLVAAAAAQCGRPVPEAAAAFVDAQPESASSPVTPTSGNGVGDDQQTARAMARDLLDGENSSIVVGLLGAHHRDGAIIRTLGRALAELTGSTFGTLTDGANSAGGYLAGALPHRGPGGVARSPVGLDAHAMLQTPRGGYLLVNVEPQDFRDAALAASAFAAAHCVVALTAFDSPALREHADVMLPVGTFAETEGTFVNVAGDWQSWDAAARLVGDARPAWKVLRVLGGLLGAPGMEWASAPAVLDAVRREVESAEQKAVESRPPVLQRVGGAIEDRPMYGLDPLLRRSPPLLATAEGRASVAVYD